MIGVGLGGSGKVGAIWGVLGVGIGALSGFGRERALKQCYSDPDNMAYSNILLSIKPLPPLGQKQALIFQ